MFDVFLWMIILFIYLCLHAVYDYLTLLKFHLTDDNFTIILKTSLCVLELLMFGID